MNQKHPAHGEGTSEKKPPPPDRQWKLKSQQSHDSVGPTPRRKLFDDKGDDDDDNLSGDERKGTFKDQY